MSYPTSETPPQSSQAPNKGPSNPHGWRWQEDQGLLFLRLLYQAKLDGKLNSTKKAVTRRVLEEFVPAFEARWNNSRWNSRVFENRLQATRRIWRAFRDLYDKSGTECDEGNRGFHASDENIAAFKRLWKGTANTLLEKGLLVGEGVTLETWASIFSNDLPGGRFIVEAVDEAGFEALEDEIEPVADPRDEGPLEEATDDDGASEAAPDDVFEEEQVIPPLPEAEQLEISSAQSSAATPQSVSAARLGAAAAADSQRRSRSLLTSTPSSQSRMKRLNSLEIGPNEGPGPLVRRKRLKQQSSPTVEEVKELFLAARSSDRVHIVKARAIGSDDLERAIADCLETLDDRNKDEVLKAVKWLSEDLKRPVVWNVFKSKELKRSWIDMMMNS